jgi:hypothetical protein
MNRFVRVAGLAACLLAVLLANGGHWAVLQSIAWTRMIVDYSRDNSLSEAVEMTFDGEHPCKMCHKIREGRQQEENDRPVLKWEKLPEFPLEAHRVAVPRPPTGGDDPIAFALTLRSDFLPTPPTPPPRPA